MSDQLATPFSWGRGIDRNKPLKTYENKLKLCHEKPTFFFFGGGSFKTEGMYYFAVAISKDYCVRPFF